MHYALILSDDNNIHRVEFAEGQPIPLEALQGAVGGWIELIRLTTPTSEANGIDMYVNEEGLLRDLPFNPLATRLGRMLNGNVNLSIVGNAIITATSHNGDAVGLTEEQSSFLIDAIGAGDRWLVTWGRMT